VSELRHRLIQSHPAPAPAARAHILEEIALAVQLYSYADDYETRSPTLEHLGEILDKFEEDVLGAPLATARAARRATIAFGPAMPVPCTASRAAVRILTDTLEGQVRGLLDGLRRPQVAPARPAALLLAQGLDGVQA
jgi:hypothetical protein